VQFEDLHKANHAKITRAANSRNAEPPTNGHRPASLFDHAVSGDGR
jgi:hypothetical protein